MLTYIAALVVVLPAIVMAYPITSCGAGMPTPTEFRIENCTSSPCIVFAGDTIQYEFDFPANAASATLTLRVDLTALGETIEFPIPDDIANVCNWLVDANCPVSPGQQLTKSSAIVLDTELHGGIPAVGRMRVYNADESLVVCAYISVVIY